MNTSPAPDAARDDAPKVPHDVIDVVRMLSAQAGVRSIWLIGSRANGKAHALSDWDLLVFRDQPVIPLAIEHPGIDIIDVDACDTVLAEGQSEDYRFPLSDMEWTETGDGVASYRGKRFVDYPEAQTIDSNAPRFIRERLRALCLWPAPSTVSPR